MKKKKIIFKPEFVLVALVLGFVPMIVHMHTYNTGMSQFDWYPQVNETHNDFFLYYKMIAIILISCIMAGILVYQIRVKKVRMKWSAIWLALAGYGVLVLLSGLFSQYRYWSFRGGYEVFESVWVILGYVLICYFAYQSINSYQDIDSVFVISSVGILIVSGIGFFQYFNLDFFKTTLGKKLITNRSMWNSLENIQFLFGDRISYTTLYNTNYLAFYFGLLIPVFVLLIIYDKRRSRKCIYGILLLFSFISLIGSGSKSGLLALGIALLLGMVIFWKKLLQHKWIPIILATGLIALIVVYASRMGGFSSLYNAIFKGLDIAETDYKVKQVETRDDDVTIRLEDENLHISYNVNEETGNVDTFIKDDAGNDIDSVYTGENYITKAVVEQERYAGCAVTPIYIEDTLGMLVEIDGLQMYFSNQNENGDGSYYFYNRMGKYDKMPDVEVSSFFDSGFASGRGTIWNKIIPKLKNSLILGTGANTFMMVYPNDDYLYKEYMQTYYLYDVKAHSLYFQQFLENGLLALILLLVFYAWYFVNCIKLYFGRNEYDSLSGLGIGIFLGTFTYMIVGLANDSNVNTAPVFWVLLGIGIAINELKRKENIRNTER